MPEESVLDAAQTYDPNRLLDTVIERMDLKNDAALSRVTGIAPPLISKVRHRRLPVGAGFLLRLHEETGMSIQELRNALGDRRQKFRVSDTFAKQQPRS